MTYLYTGIGIIVVLFIIKFFLPNKRHGQVIKLMTIDNRICDLYYKTRITTHLDPSTGIDVDKVYENLKFGAETKAESGRSDHEHWENTFHHFDLLRTIIDYLEEAGIDVQVDILKELASIILHLEQHPFRHAK